MKPSARLQKPFRRRVSTDTQSIRIRSLPDRIRYALLFELILIVLMGLALKILSGRPFFDTGLLAVILSGIAVIVALAYNYAFDRIDVSLGRVPTERSPVGRVVHAVGMELTLVFAGLPVIMVWMRWPLADALVFNLSAMAAIVLYTYLFTLAYDRLFPVAQSEAPASEATH